MLDNVAYARAYNSDHQQTLLTQVGEIAIEFFCVPGLLLHGVLTPGRSDDVRIPVCGGGC